MLRSIWLNLMAPNLAISVAVVEEEHLTRAAGRLGIPQPTVSHAMQRMNDAIGAPLVRRIGRGIVPSPGRPTVAWREDRVRFWAAIAISVLTDAASEVAGVSAPVGYRWIRHPGGVNPQLSTRVSGRYPSFVEREDIALLRAQGLGLRAIVRRLRRDGGRQLRVGPQRGWSAGVPRSRSSASSPTVRPARAAAARLAANTRGPLHGVESMANTSRQGLVKPTRW